MHITKRLRQIRNARHFRFALNLVLTAQWFKFGDGVAHYLTQRYTYGDICGKKSLLSAHS